MTFPYVRATLFRRGPFRSFGGCSSLSIHGRQKTAWSLTRRFFYALRPSSAAAFSRFSQAPAGNGCTAFFVALQQFFSSLLSRNCQLISAKALYGDESVFFSILEPGGDPPYYPAQRNKTSVILLRSMRIWVLNRKIPNILIKASLFSLPSFYKAQKTTDLRYIPEFCGFCYDVCM